MKTAGEQTEAVTAPGAGEVLASRQWLRAHLDDPRVRVVEVDVSPAAYNDWHIDGAVLWNVYADLKDAAYRTVDAAALQRLIARSGIGPESTVVCYGYAPALALWLLKLHGHRDVRILDCSRDTWQAEGYPCTAEVSQPPAGIAERDSTERGDADPRLRAGQAAVLDAIGRPGVTLVDVRSANEYHGERFWPSGGMEPAGAPGTCPRRSTIRLTACTTRTDRSGRPTNCGASSPRTCSTGRTS